MLPISHIHPPVGDLYPFLYYLCGEVFSHVHALVRGNGPTVPYTAQMGLDARVLLVRRFPA